MNVRKITIEDNLEILHDMHKSISINNNVYNVLIYYDVNFLSYLKRIINHPNEYLYGLFKNDCLIGFLHFKMLTNTLFLNNIFLSENERGGGNGSFFLTKATEDLSFGFKKFCLDVFKSNIAAFRWYEKLGLKCIDSKFWVKIVNQRKINADVDMAIYRDENGFKSIYLKENKIGTIVNDAHVLVNDVNFIRDIISLNLEVYACAPLELFKDFDYLILEETCRMEGDFNSYYTILKNT